MTLNPVDPTRHLSPRPGEQRLGEVMLQWQGQPLAAWLAEVQQLGGRFVLLGVPESIGPRANCGRGGAERGWSAFLDQWLNWQSNPAFDGRCMALLGSLAVEDLMQQADALDPSQHGQLEQLRALTEQLDQRLTPVIQAVVAAGLEPVVIGGGHNNALPILAGASAALSQPLAAVNLDPHADFRRPEGRHSGNGFRYACQQGHLNHYQVLGLHEQKNNAEAMSAMAEAGVKWYSLQRMWLWQQPNLADVLASVLAQLPSQPLGVEVDLDAISEIPSSAVSRLGISPDQACYLVHRLAQQPGACYLHLAEGAPDDQPGSARRVGQMLAELVLSYCQGRLSRKTS
ncbi:formimidoylglutamase [Ferrimonas marina]|uniref:Arginase family enzyme n=1 Tax=Ferrimonas marina TaxID=299255 RepID=A0A1M5XXN4_9GAMM|nr:formimidoylglutamase [Ferrimonas marina]SHI04575.1 Arginase family enzyme [Ferrimonas marina]